MDGLKMQVFDTLRGAKSGDAKVDELNDNVANHIIGIIRKYEDAKARIDGKRKHFTKAGLAEEIEKAQKDAVNELKALDEKASWAKDIAEVNKKFDIVQDKNELQILIEESRQREARLYMKEYSGDSLMFTKEFGRKIEEGDPTIVQAILNSPVEIPVDARVLEAGIAKMRLRQNPDAAQRLEVLENAQEIYTDLINFARREIGIEPELKMTVHSG